MYHIFFIHSSLDGHLGCFRVPAIVNSAAVNIGVHVFFFFFFLGACVFLNYGFLWENLEGFFNLFSVVHMSLKFVIE